MRIFLDANMISPAAHWPQGRSRALFRLAATGRCELVASPHAIGEAHRNLILKSPRGAEALDALLERVEKVAEVTGEVWFDSVRLSSARDFASVRGAGIAYVFQEAQASLNLYVKNI